MTFLSDIAFAEEQISDGIPGNKTDSISLSFSDKKIRPTNFYPDADSFSLSRRHIHRISLDARPGYIFPTNSFLRGENERWKPIRSSFSAHLRYSFQFQPNTFIDRIYGGPYQGIGLAYYTLDNRKELGNPIAFYLLQGARIARITPQLSFNYEWNLGLSLGWKPYDQIYNYYKKVIGPDMNA